jgi:hypothetical protein
MSIESPDRDASANNPEHSTTLLRDLIHNSARFERFTNQLQEIEELSTLSSELLCYAEHVRHEAATGDDRDDMYERLHIKLSGLASLLKHLPVNIDLQ